MTEPTNEMRDTLWRILPSEVQEGREPDDILPWVKAVLAIVERDQAGPCPAGLPIIFGGGRAWCTLRHGHQGDHIDGTTRWRETGAARRGPS